MYDLYVDGTSRVIENLLPSGQSWPTEPAGALLIQIQDADAQRIHAAWVAASQAGQQLVVAADLTTSTVTPSQTPYQQAVQVCANYLNDSSLDAFMQLTAANPPTAAQNLYVNQHTIATLRALTKIVRGLVNDS